MPGGQLKSRMSEFRQVLLANRPLAASGGDVHKSAGSAVRMPGDSSQRKRRENLARGVINLDDKVHARILELSR
jgi:LDH2 family malate/lactate/ureidoglycolate dehydrogenase